MFLYAGGTILLIIEKNGNREEIHLEDPGIKRFILSRSEFHSQPLWQKLRNRKEGLIFCNGGGFLEVTAAERVILNGVSTRTGRLFPGDFLRWSGWRITYIGQQKGLLSFSSLPGRLIFPLRIRYICLLIPLLSGLLAFSFFIPGRVHDTPMKVSGEIHTQELPSALEQNVFKEPEVSLSSGDLLIVAPGETVPAEKTDVLFIHAHPDDESLDYGALLSRLDLAGKRTAVLLLTDGESGIFREGYTGERRNLRQIRLREVEKALRVLGCDLFIRFGLPNHPYNGLADILTSGEVLDSWGGKEVLAARIAGVISILKPGIIVSPDGPSMASEHFEHETAGIAVAAALEYMHEQDLQLPGAHLLAVDPRQHDLYPDALAVSRENVLSRQTEALLSHQTQADAAVFGVEMIYTLRSEYYAVRSWNMEISPHEYPGL